MTAEPRPAIVTPYCREDRAVLERCIASVAAQTVPSDHILVADGHPPHWVDALAESNRAVTHLKLDRAHGDFGNVARGIGGLLAAGRGATAIGFLDADNAIDVDHVERCLAAAAAMPDCDYVAARRRFVTPDGLPLPVAEDRDVLDTNCLFLMPGAFAAIGHWATMPRQLSPVGDRIFAAALIRRGYIAARTAEPSVTYTSLWAPQYAALGLPAPEGAKGIDTAAIRDWLVGLDTRQRTIVDRLAGTRITLG